MKWNLKICENPNCWEIVWCFPRKKCRFCWSTDISTHTIAFKWFIEWHDIINPYYNNRCLAWILENYKWIDHLIIRVKPWEWNDCDNNWGYIHIVDYEWEKFAGKIVKEYIKKPTK